MIDFEEELEKFEPSMEVEEAEEEIKKRDLDRYDRYSSPDDRTENGEIKADMKCYMRGTLVDQEEVCPHCGSDLKIYRVILASSNLFVQYRLEQAQVRDLSGAIVSLKKEPEVQ